MTVGTYLSKRTNVVAANKPIYMACSLIIEQFGM